MEESAFNALAEAELARIESAFEDCGAEIDIEPKPGGILEIEFDNGSVIQHTSVGEEIARRFLAASAPASVYKDTIQDEFTQRRIR